LKAEWRVAREEVKSGSRVCETARGAAEGNVGRWESGKVGGSQLAGVSVQRRISDIRGRRTAFGYDFRSRT
jgi:hypothetical protein